jgi:DNA-binding NarL/FixJ family response regulator
MKKITVLLAEDHTIVREGFRKMLEMEDDIEVAGEAQDGRQAVALVHKLRPAVVLMDIAMPLLNGLEATRQVLKAIPATKVLILSSSNKPPPTMSAARSGKSTRETLFSVPPFPGDRTVSIRRCRAAPDCSTRRRLN